MRGMPDLRLVLANMRVLFSLATTWSSYAGNGATESMLAITRLGAAANRQSAVVDRPGADNDHQGATGDR
jgi:hypothetical protein